MPGIPPSVFKALRIALKDYITKLRVIGVKGATEAGVKNASRLSDNELARYVQFTMEAPTSREAARTQAIATGKALELATTPAARREAFTERKRFMTALTKADPKNFLRRGKELFKDTGQAKQVKQEAERKNVDFLQEEVTRLKRKKGEIDELDERRLDQIPPEDLAEIRSILDDVAQGKPLKGKELRISDEEFQSLIVNPDDIISDVKIPLADLPKGLQDKLLKGKKLTKEETEFLDQIRNREELKSRKLTDKERFALSKIQTGKTLKRPFKKEGPADVLAFPSKGKRPGPLFPEE